MPVKFSGRAQSSVAPATNLVAINPSDDTDLPDGPTRGVFVGTGGTLMVVSLMGSTVRLVSAAGQYHPIRIVRVLATGTSASDIVALY